MANRSDVAKWAGVSEATVSRVFSGGAVKEATKRKVLAAAEKLDYLPNAVAQNFAKGRSGHIGIILPYLPKVRLFSVDYFSELLSGLGEAVREEGYDLLLLLRSPEEQDYSELFRARKVDALVILGAKDTPEQKSTLDALKKEGLPFCLIDQQFTGSGFNEIIADNTAGGYMATQHLIARGYRSIAFLGGPATYSNARDRLRGYKLAMEEAGLPIRDQDLLQGNFSRKSGYEAALKLIRQGLPDAVFAANDRMGVGLIQGFKESGRLAGRDIAVIGFDNTDASKMCDPALSTVDVPYFEMGKVAAKRLLQQIFSGDRLPFHERLPVQLVVRHSCARAGEGIILG
ncbi:MULTISPECIES: LacI family DNA-binding transcriptional regulator [Cohnella]|uniref:LacI family transcriptional regulator n=1 Tax=Cohnella phaseoli TaxID=456490 RepID=A0A3D9IVW1_9BACL|nr:LacI family DNA-binding transcriptional regulator [Cohnella phaseoli]RED65266.1 LacI family transcriptional regulator [Cohnella phaseoli]